VPLTREGARACVERGLAEANALGFKVAIVGAVGVSGAVPADNDPTIADAAAGHPVLPQSHSKRVS
jgi:uncharacterized protein GlcG (DUF336 family)